MSVQLFGRWSGKIRTRCRRRGPSDPLSSQRRHLRSSSVPAFNVAHHRGAWDAGVSLQLKRSVILAKDSAWKSNNDGGIERAALRRFQPDPCCSPARSNLAAQPAFANRSRSRAARRLRAHLQDQWRQEKGNRARAFTAAA